MQPPSSSAMRCRSTADSQRADRANLFTHQPGSRSVTDVSPFFKPFSIRGLSLKNRIVMAPMTRSRSPGAFPNAENVGYYERRAANEVGLILS
ncbi:MAG: hypothetical protein ABW321_27510, partial [Polyangiales bacterium]